MRAGAAQRARSDAACGTRGTWLFSPANDQDLDRAIDQVSRLVTHLRELGVLVQTLPGGELLIPGELRWKDVI